VSSRRRTIAEARFPKTAEFHHLLSHWATDASLLMLQFVWRGHDYLKEDVLDRIDARQSDEDLERSVTQLLEPRIRRAMTGDEPFEIQHGSYEHETRQPPPAQPPQYDLAFVLRANPRIMWPLEAKLIRSDGDVGRYASELRDNFLTCRYAPFSRGGAMMGYVLCSAISAVFENISKTVPCKLFRVNRFSARPHRRSSHLRKVPAGKRYVRRFRCHHLLLALVPITS
jgi:hypothetical protein